MIDIKILNSDKELDSFPITQSIYLQLNKYVDVNTLSNHIILFRTLPENNLISLVEPYSYTIGYIKETFTPSELTFSIEDTNDGNFKLTIKPVKQLELDSGYILYIDHALQAYNPIVSKYITKSNSSLSVSVTAENSKTTSTVEVIATSTLTANGNAVSFNIDGKTYSLNLKQNKTITIQGVTYIFTDTVYVQGETWNLSLPTSFEMNADDMLYKISTAPSSSIKVIPTQQPSSTIDTQSIINFYNKVSNVKETINLIPTYHAPNIFSISLPDGFTINQNKDILLSIKEAFNNYLLTQMELYDSSHKYVVLIYTEGSQIYIEVIYTEELDSPAITVLINDEETSYQVRKYGL